MPKRAAIELNNDEESKRLAADSTQPENEIATCIPGNSDASSPTNESIEDDWKETLFYWRGVLNQTDPYRMTWKGAWVGSASGLPTESDFRASTNTFSLTGRRALRDRTFAVLALIADRSQPHPMTMLQPNTGS